MPEDCRWCKLARHPLFEKSRGRESCGEDSSRCPGELVLPRICAPARRQTTAEGLEYAHCATPVMDVVDGSHCEHVVEPRIETALVEQRDAGRARLCVQRAHVV